MSPRGRAIHPTQAREWAAGPGLVILCPRFEGIDERVIEARGLLEVSIGDYVLVGGEIAALAVLDACVRLIPGVMGKEESGGVESFESGLLEYPHYTRPREWEGRAIPDVLLSGDHAKSPSGGGARRSGSRGSEGWIWHNVIFRLAQRSCSNSPLSRASRGGEVPRPDIK